MNPRRKQRLIVTVLVLGLTSGAMALVLFALSENIDLFYTPSEIIQGKQGQKPQIGQRLRIGGMVVPNSVKRDQQTLDVVFELVDVGPKISVEFNGILPDLFREGQGIVATGTLVGPTHIKADEVLAKHDEEYMPPELAEQMKGIRHVKPDEASY